MEDSTTETIRASVDNKIDRFVQGDLKHAAEMLTALWDSANAGGDVEAPAGAALTVSHPRILPFCVRCSSALHMTSSAGRRVQHTGPP